MSAAPKIPRLVVAPSVAERPPAAVGREDASALAQRMAVRLGNDWLPRAAWTISRTGRAGLLGIALLLGAALFLLSTHLRVAAEVEAMRTDLATAQRQPGTPPATRATAPASTLPALPARNDMPAVLRQLFNQATRARLAVDTAKYEVDTTKSGGGVVRYRITFPVTGPYPQIRTFLDATLATMPSVALTDLVLERKSITDFNVEAQIKMTIYARSEP